MANIASDGIPEIQNFITICGFTAGGIQYINALDNVYLKDVKGMTENLSRLHINWGGAYIGNGATTNLTDLILWIQESRAQRLVPDPNTWNQKILNDDHQRMNLERQSCDSVSEDIAPPKCLDQTKWTDSYLALMNYLRT